jgi:short-subunit dehydrogenase
MQPPKNKKMKKTCIISGGSSGLGLEIADLLLKKGKSIVILGRDEKRLEKAIARLNSFSHKGEAISFACNIGNEPEVKKFGEYLADNKYFTEYLINNAGRGLFAKASNTTSGMIDAVFEPNLKGLILLTTEILRLTPQEEELSIVNIMSTSALLGRAEESVYCAAKWGARGYTEALRSELKGSKRNIIAVYPGGMMTGFWKVVDHNRDISGFMDPAEVAEKIVNAVLVKERLAVTEITITRK